MSATSSSERPRIDLNTAVEPSKKNEAPITQEKQGFRERLPEWMKQLPRIRFPEEPNENFELIDPVQLEKIITSAKATPDAIAQLNSDLAFLDRELLRLFRQRDFEAKYQQNRYRFYQIAYMVLAATATVIGSFLAVSLNSAPDWVPFLGFLETIIAVMTTFLATVSANEPALPLWLENRRKAEQMRREYFRFLMDLAPYDALDNYERRRKLAVRVANINRGLADANVEPPSIYAGSGATPSTPSSTHFPFPAAASDSSRGGGSGSSSGTGSDNRSVPASSRSEAISPPTTPETPLNPNDPSTAGS